MGILIDCKMLCLPLPLFLPSPISGIGVLPRTPVVVTRDNRAAVPLLLLQCKAQGQASGFPGAGRGLDLCRHQMNQLGGTVECLITCVSALF